ncbi:hypothetical protein LZ32DRAFT_605205 [Colletotrichum eremochloae]|nr:hypothetical protein LZ32DRAFT_605205 [Colletotrichum eremochloae]
MQMQMQAKQKSRRQEETREDERIGSKDGANGTYLQGGSIHEPRRRRVEQGNRGQQSEEEERWTGKKD